MGLYDATNYTEKILKEGDKLIKMSNIDYIETEIRPIINKYDTSKKKKSKYRYNEDFDRYVDENNIKFSNVPSIRRQQMYNTEYNRRTGEINPPWHELPTWEKLIRLVGSMM